MEDIVLDTESGKVDNSFWLLKSRTGIWVVRLKGERSGETRERDGNRKEEERATGN